MQALFGDESYGVLIKQAPVAPIWARIGLSYIAFREASEYGTPGAQFQRKTTKNLENIFSMKHKGESTF